MCGEGSHDCGGVGNESRDCMCACCDRRNVDSSGLQLQKKKSVTGNICLPGSKEPGLFLLHGYRL